MKKNKIIKILIFLLILVISLIYWLSSMIGNNDYRYLKNLLNNDQRYTIKKYLFPYTLINQLEEKLSLSNSLESELKFKEKLETSTILKDIKLSNDMFLTRLKLYGGFYSGINNKSTAGSGFIDFYNDNFFILSSLGVLLFSENINLSNSLKQIKNNIDEFINLKQFKKSEQASLKDILIYKNKIFISYTKEIRTDCWNTSVIFGDINFNHIIFEKLFSPKECIHSKYNIDDEFNLYQSGGRMVGLDKNNILLTIGDYRERHYAQNKKSVNGKIIKININNSDHEIISMGHRNPQGLYFDKGNNFILQTEHGPEGGDEINLIDIEEINKGKILNYGWAISSAGEHYGGKTDENKKKYKKYPLYKSHSKYGFIEPLKSFVPSIGISEIVKVGENTYVASSMRDKSLYFFELNKQKQIINLERVEVFERVRDLSFINNQLYLFMENTASIGVINLN